MKFCSRCAQRGSTFYYKVALLFFLLSWGGNRNFFFSSHTPPATQVVSQSLDKTVLHVGNGMEPANLDPTKVMGISEINILVNLFEGLTVPDPVSWEPIPGAAAYWEISPDGKRYVFHLRP